jgi:general secretion pathway protein I
MNKRQVGFTLIEVLIALMILSIALTALLKATGQNVATAGRLQEKTISHWVAMQGVAMVQLGLLPIQLNQELTQLTHFLNQHWYWRIKVTSTSIKSIQKMSIRVSQNPQGPFTDSLIAYRYAP